MKSNKSILSPNIIGSFKITKTIGKGTFGKVKLGIHLLSKEKVAIKILEKSKILEKDDYDRIIREMEILSEIDHLNLIKALEIHESNECYFIIMEYCEGGELFDYIVKKDRLSEKESSYFYYQLINGLHHLHSKRIVHRDLKPENLLLAENNVLKIIDFGLSNFYTGKPLSTPCGSPSYASPEMVSGHKYNGYDIDIWSTGIILFAMLCGYLPFEDEDKDNEVLFEKILSCKVEYPSHLSRDSKDLMMKILVPEPNKRIKIDEIKKHPFYLKGKRIFEEKINKENERKESEGNEGNMYIRKKKKIQINSIPTEGNERGREIVNNKLYKDYFDNRMFNSNRKKVAQNLMEQKQPQSEISNNINITKLIKGKKKPCVFILNDNKDYSNAMNSDLISLDLTSCANNKNSVQLRLNTTNKKSDIINQYYKNININRNLYKGVNIQQIRPRMINQYGFNSNLYYTVANRNNSKEINFDTGRKLKQLSDNENFLPFIGKNENFWKNFHLGTEYTYCVNNIINSRMKQKSNFGRIKTEEDEIMRVNLNNRSPSNNKKIIRVGDLLSMGKPKRGLKMKIGHLHKNTDMEIFHKEIYSI